jgi:hypothetical protein
LINVTIYCTAVSGFSYADVAASLDVPLGPVVVALMILAQWGIDDLFMDEEVFGVMVSYAF